MAFNYRAPFSQGKTALLHVNMRLRRREWLMLGIVGWEGEKGGGAGMTIACSGPPI